MGTEMEKLRISRASTTILVKNPARFSFIDILSSLPGGSSADRALHLLGFLSYSIPFHAGKKGIFRKFSEFF